MTPWYRPWLFTLGGVLCCALWFAWAALVGSWTQDVHSRGVYRDSGAPEWDATQEVRAATLAPPLPALDWARLGDVPGECWVVVNQCARCDMAVCGCGVRNREE